MNEIHVEEFDKMSNLKPELEKLERAHLGNDSRDLHQAREALLAAVRSHWHNRYELGRTLRQYRTHFKANRGWMTAARLIAAALDYDERTISRIIDDYERVSSLPPIAIEALQDQGIDPAAGKNALIVESLLQMSIPETREQAAMTVSGAVSKYVVQKTRGGSRRQQTENVEAFAEKIVKQFEKRYRSMIPHDRDLEIQYVFELIATTLGSSIPQLRQYSQPALVPRPSRQSAA